MLGKIICIMEMYKSLLMCIYNILWKKESLGNILAYLASHIISLDTVYCRILVRILLLNLLVITLKKA